MLNLHLGAFFYYIARDFNQSKIYFSFDFLEGLCN